MFLIIDVFDLEDWIFLVFIDTKNSEYLLRHCFRHCLMSNLFLNFRRHDYLSMSWITILKRINVIVSWILASQFSTFDLDIQSSNSFKWTFALTCWWLSFVKFFQLVLFFLITFQHCFSKNFFLANFCWLFDDRIFLKISEFINCTNEVI